MKPGKSSLFLVCWWLWREGLVTFEESFCHSKLTNFWGGYFFLIQGLWLEQELLLVIVTGSVLCSYRDLWCVIYRDELSSQKCQDEEQSGLYKMILIASHLLYPETWNLGGLRAVLFLVSRRRISLPLHLLSCASIPWSSLAWRRITSMSASKIM